MEVDVDNNEHSISAHSILRHKKRTLELFLGNHGSRIPDDRASLRVKLAAKVHDEYSTVKDLPPPAPAPRAAPTAAAAPKEVRAESTTASPAAPRQPSSRIGHLATPTPRQSPLPKQTPRGIAPELPEQEDKIKILGPHAFHHDQVSISLSD